MPILKLKDKDKKIYSIPALQGEKGSLIFSDTDKEEVIINTFDLMPQAEELLL